VVTPTALSIHLCDCSLCLRPRGSSCFWINAWCKKNVGLAQACPSYSLSPAIPVVTGKSLHECTGATNVQLCHSDFYKGVITSLKIPATQQFWCTIFSVPISKWVIPLRSLFSDVTWAVSKLVTTPFHVWYWADWPMHLIGGKRLLATWTVSDRKPHTWQLWKNGWKLLFLLSSCVSIIFSAKLSAVRTVSKVYKAVPSYRTGGATAPPEKLASEYNKISFVHSS